MAEKPDEHATKREIVPDMVVIKVTWWNGRQWYTSHEVRSKEWAEANRPEGEMSDTEILIGRIQAAEWDAKLARKPGLSEDRRQIYLLNIEQQLESALRILRTEA